MVDYSYKHIWKITYPILLSLVMEQLIGLTDTAFMGRVGEVELGASAIAGVFFLVIFMVGHGFCIGAQILIGRRNGEGAYGEIGKIFYQGVWFLMALALVLFVLSRMFANDILSLMISSPHVLDKAEQYLQWRVYGFFFAFGGGMFRAFFVGTTQTKTLTLNSVVMVLSNVVFNYILVFGKLGCPAMGIGGAALGSSLSEMVSVIFFILYTRRKVDYKKYALNVVESVNLQRLRQILKLSLWVMVQNFLSLSTWFIFFVYVEHLGEQQLAITNIVRSLSGFLFMGVMAFASSCSSIVSNMIGAGQTDTVFKAIGNHVRLAFLSILPFVTIIALFPSPFIAIYTDIPNLTGAVVPSVLVMCSSYLFIIPSNILFSSVSGTGSTKVAFYLEVSVLAVYVAYITFLIYHLRVDVALAWTSEILYASLIGIVCFVYLHSGAWRKISI